MTMSIIYIRTMNARQFFDKVVDMRAAQSLYFKTRDKADLAAAKSLEAEIDAEIQRVKLVLKAKNTLGEVGLL